jgi:hypothetical protein
MLGKDIVKVTRTTKRTTKQVAFVPSRTGCNALNVVAAQGGKFVGPVRKRGRGLRR